MAKASGKKGEKSAGGRKNGKTVLYLVRHGRACGNKRHILNGRWRDVPLTHVGYRQAKEFAEKWHIKPDVIVSSPMRRARSTAGFLSRKLKMHVEIEPLLYEQDCGKWTGLNYYEKMKTRPEHFFFDRGKVSTYMKNVPGGESWEDLMARARKILASLKRKYEGKTIVAFSHGVIMHACVSAATGIPAPEVYRIDIKNTHWRRLEI